jgi:integrase
MSKLPLRFVQAWVDEEGRPHHYFRRRGFKRRRLPGMPGTIEFNRAYEAAMAESPQPIGADTRSKPGTIAAAVAAYLDSQLYFGSKAKGTQANYRSILNRFRDKYGCERLAGMPSTFVAAVVSPLPPQTARTWLKTLRVFCEFAVSQGLLKVNPVLSVKLPKMKATGGHHTWTDEEIAQYEAHHPIGSDARLALALGLYTVQRRADVIRMGRQHIRSGMLHVRQRKTGVELDLPVRPELAMILATSGGNNLTFLTKKNGKPYSENEFSMRFRVWCSEASLPKHCVFHGLRKAGCRILAHLGCTPHEIKAWSGHETLKEVERYTKAVEQDRLAQSALAKVMAGIAENKMAQGSVKVDHPQVSKPLKRLRKKAS